MCSLQLIRKNIQVLIYFWTLIFFIFVKYFRTVHSALCQALLCVIVFATTLQFTMQHYTALQ